MGSHKRIGYGFERKDFDLVIRLTSADGVVVSEVNSKASNEHFCGVKGINIEGCKARALGGKQNETYYSSD